MPPGRHHRGGSRRGGLDRMLKTRHPPAPRKDGALFLAQPLSQPVTTKGGRTRGLYCSPQYQLLQNFNALRGKFSRALLTGNRYGPRDARVARYEHQHEGPAPNEELRAPRGGWSCFPLGRGATTPRPTLRQAGARGPSRVYEIKEGSEVTLEPAPQGNDHRAKKKCSAKKGKVSPGKMFAGRAVPRSAPRCPSASLAANSIVLPHQRLRYHPARKLIDPLGREQYRKSGVSIPVKVGRPPSLRSNLFFRRRIVPARRIKSTRGVRDPGNRFARSDRSAVRHHWPLAESARRGLGQVLFRARHR